MGTDAFHVGASSVICHVFGAVTALLLRALLGPTAVGTWQGLKLFLSYGNYANLGVTKAAVRDYAVARGRRDPRGGERELGVALTASVVASCVYAFVLVAVACWIAWTGGGWGASAWAWGIGGVALLTVLNRFVTFQVTVLRTERRFRVTSELSLVEAVTTCVGCAWAAWFWGLAGLLLATGVVMLTAQVFLWWRGTHVPRLHWDWAVWRRLASSGGPMVLAGAASSLFRSIDKILILVMLADGAYQLGCYSVGLMVIAQIYGLANSVATIMQPRYGEWYGATNDRAVVARKALKTAVVGGALVAVVAGCVIAVAPAVVAWGLPAYVSGLRSMVILVPGAIALACALPCSQVLIATGRERMALLAVVTATLFGSALTVAVLLIGAGINGVAAATSLSYFAYFGLVFAAAMGVYLDRGTTVRLIGGAMVWFGAFVVWPVCLSLYDMDRAIDPVTAAARCVCWGVGGGAAMWFLVWNRRARPRSEESAG